MKKLMMIGFFFLIATCMQAKTTCEVEGSSNNNIAILNESYVKSWTNGHSCCLETSISLSKPSLGETSIILEIFNDDGRHVANKNVMIEKNKQYSGEIFISVNKRNNGDNCGYFSIKIAGASCNEKVEQMKKIKSSDSYIDLGLPSGTRWKNSNENGYYKIFNAIFTFDNALPSKEQWEELIDNCEWEWAENGAKVIGKNGNSIFLPSNGLYVYCTNAALSTYGEYVLTQENWTGNYCSSTLDSMDNGYYLHFAQSEVEITKEDVRLRGTNALTSVRLVEDKNPIQRNFVDLGLPSGTKWKSINERERFTQSEAIAKFGKQLPSKEQWEELIKLCEWKYCGLYYEVSGPNKNSIIIRNEGILSNEKIIDNEDILTDVGFNAFYWTSSSKLNNNVKSSIYIVVSGKYSKFNEEEYPYLYGSVILVSQ